ncbi:MAG: hypothetical protein SGILL_006958 [Bacillariaceae sp.]
MTVLQLISAREAGPMLKSENKKRQNYGDEEQELETALSAIRRETDKSERSWNWWVPVLTLNIVLWATFLQLDGENFDDDQTKTAIVSSFMTSSAATVILIQLFYLYQPQKKPDFRQLLFWRKDEARLAYLTDTFPSGSSSVHHAATSVSNSDEIEAQHVDDDFDDVIERPKNTRRRREMPDETPQKRNCMDFWNCVGSLKESCILSPTETLECLLRGTILSVPMVLSLLFSWSTGDVYIGLGLDRIATGWILNDNLASEAVPTVAFLSAFLLSVMLGSSWTTISIVLPAVSLSLLNTTNQQTEHFTLVIGSILSGAVAGDHIGPFSETTILSGLTTCCGTRRHFLTQVPYGFSVLLLSVFVGTVPLSFGAYPEFFGFFIGCIVICIAVVFVCRRVQTPKFVPGRASEAITKEIHSIRKEPNQNTYLGEAAIAPVNTEDLIDRDEDQTVGKDEIRSIIESESAQATNELTPVIRTHTLQSFKSKLQEVNSSGEDPILGLVADGLLPSDITTELTSPAKQQTQSVLAKIPRDPRATPNKKIAFESKKKLIEATIESSEKDGNIFSESLRMFLRTAQNNLDHIMSEGSIDIKASESNGSDDDSLDHLMSDIAAKGWKSAVELAGKDDDAETDAGDGYTTAGGYTTGGEYTTDGGHSTMGESEYSASAVTTSSGDGHSTAFTTDGENTSNGPSITASEDGTQGAEQQLRLDPAMLINPLAKQSQQVLAWMNGNGISEDESDTATDHESQDPSKASF